MLELAQIQEIATQHATPFYLYDLDRIESGFADFKEVFKGKKSLICYALKANSNLALLQHLAKLGCGADCVSIYEVRKALLAGIKPYHIIFSGVGKLEHEISLALASKILFLNVESFAELRLIERIARDLGLKARISVRVNPNIDALTHPYISTGLWENKFGVEEKEAVQMFMFAKQSAFLEPIAMQFHIGSQLTDLAPLSEACTKMGALARFLVASGVELKFFDVGGGLGIDYSQEQNQSLIDLNAYASAIFQALKELDLTIICEPGRKIVGDSGVLVSQVQYTKHNERKHFAIIDAGMNDFLRPALYQATHPIYTTSDPTNPKQTYDLVGPICESADCFARGVQLPTLKRGDLVILDKVGAYGASMASHYNSRPKILELGLSQGTLKVLKPKEKLAHMISDELGCLGVENLGQSRAQIDHLDQQISALLQQRLQIARQIAQHKQSLGLKSYYPVREAQIFKGVGKGLESIFTEILGVSRSLLGPEKIGFCGLEGDIRRAFGQSASLQELDPPALIQALQEGGIDFGAFLVQECLKDVLPALLLAKIKAIHSLEFAKRWYLVVARADFALHAEDILEKKSALYCLHATLDFLTQSLKPAKLCHAHPLGTHLLLEVAHTSAPQSILDALTFCQPTNLGTYASVEPRFGF